MYYQQAKNGHPTHAAAAAAAQVTADYSGPVSLTASELLQLMHYQQATDDHINWSNKVRQQLKLAADGGMKQPSNCPSEPQCCIGLGARYITSMQPTPHELAQQGYTCIYAAEAATSANRRGSHNCCQQMLMRGISECWLLTWHAVVGSAVQVNLEIHSVNCTLLYAL